MVKTMPLDAIVVLGCRVSAQGDALGAARRRIARAAEAHRERGQPKVVLSGGKRWNGRTEADIFARELVRLGVAEEHLLREQRSLNTRQNARYTCALAREHGFRRLGVVSCEWHLARAVSDFRSYGFDVEAIPAPAPPGVTRARRWTERVHAACDRALIRLERLGLLTLCVLFVVSSCKRASSIGEPPNASGSARVAAVGSASSGNLLPNILRAEYARRPDLIPAEAFTASDPALRAAALRALGRSQDPAQSEVLMSSLRNEASRALEFAAFGLGRSPTLQASRASRALALRSATLLGAGPASPERSAAMRAIAAALGRLGSDEAERTLRGWLALESEIAEAAALGLADVAARRSHLEDETFVALLDATERKPAPVDAALYVFARIASPKGALEERLVDVATRALGEAHADVRRAYALRALELAKSSGPLVHALGDATLTPQLRAELARALVHLGDVGKNALGKKLESVPAEPSAQRALLEGPELTAWLALLDALQSEPPLAHAGLVRLSSLEVPKTAWLARRAILLRCGAARLLAGHESELSALATCDPDPAGRVGRLALLSVLDQNKLSGARGVRFRKLATSSDALVRQAAVRLLLRHDEVENVSELLVTALGDSAPGTVAAAGEVLAERARTKNVDATVSDAFVRAFRANVDGKSSGVTSALIDASATLLPLSLVRDLELICAGNNENLRVHAERALNAFGRQKRCPTPVSKALPASSELDHVVAGKLRIAVDTELGELGLTLDPTDAPLAVTRIADLVRAGFYDGIEIHRFVPGFVLQFGDRGADGYGGSGKALLRSELGPSRFGAGSVGLAESGADTGSSQVFVTLGRFPHLDGNSTYLGEASAGWERLVVGDRILKARIVQ